MTAIFFVVSSAQFANARGANHKALRSSDYVTHNSLRPSKWEYC